MHTTTMIRTHKSLLAAQVKSIRQSACYACRQCPETILAHWPAPNYCQALHNAETHQEGWLCSLQPLASDTARKPGPNCQGVSSGTSHYVHRGQKAQLFHLFELQACSIANWFSYPKPNMPKFLVLRLRSLLTSVLAP